MSSTEEPSKPVDTLGQAQQLAVETALKQARESIEYANETITEANRILGLLGKGD